MGRIKYRFFNWVVAMMVMLNGCMQAENGLSNKEAFSEMPTSAESTERITENLKYEYETRELYAKRNENQIFGMIYIPRNAGEKLPTVIFSHGFGGSYRVGAQYAEALAEKGYAVYCFDFCGGSAGSKSDGSTLEMSVFT